jgi:hypothetical protein
MRRITVLLYVVIDLLIIGVSTVLDRPIGHVWLWYVCGGVFGFGFLMRLLVYLGCMLNYRKVIVTIGAVLVSLREREYDGADRMFKVAERELKLAARIRLAQLQTMNGHISRVGELIGMVMAGSGSPDDLRRQIDEVEGAMKEVYFTLDSRVVWLKEMRNAAMLSCGNAMVILLVLKVT